MVAPLRFDLLPPTGRILDLGASTGDNSIDLAEHGYDVIAIDLDLCLLQEGAKRCKDYGVQQCRADAHYLPLQTGSIDGAILIEVLEHFSATNQVLSELRRVIRPGGSLCIAVPTDYTERIYRWLHPGYTKNSGHLHIFSESLLCDLLFWHGFEVVERHTHNLGPALAWFIHALLHSRSDYTGKIYQHHWVELIVGGFLWCGRRTPLVRVLVCMLERRFGKSRYFYCVRSRLTFE